jgi:cell wall-associated NlpC family hydrolase
MHHLMLAIALASPPSSPTDTAQQQRARVALAWADEQLGVPYAWNGRGTSRLPGLDCLGLVFGAWGHATGTPWRAYPVNPSELVASGRLGGHVEGVDGVLRATVDDELLLPGDMLYFLLRGYRIDDAPLLQLDGHDYWPWHVGLYVGDGLVVHAEPGGVVRRQALGELRFDALLATRVGAP